MNCITRALYIQKNQIKSAAESTAQEMQPTKVQPTEAIIQTSLTILPPANEKEEIPAETSNKPEKEEDTVIVPENISEAETDIIPKKQEHHKKSHHPKSKEIANTAALNQQSFFGRDNVATYQKIMLGVAVAAAGLGWWWIMNASKEQVDEDNTIRMTN